MDIVSHVECRCDIECNGFVARAHQSRTWLESGYSSVSGDTVTKAGFSEAEYCSL